MRRRFAIFGLLAALATPALAANSFTLKNGAGSAITAFQTREDGKWSDNWLASPVRPGETFAMKFSAEEGDCVIRTRVRFQSGASAEGDVDYCEARTVTATEQGVSGR